MPNDPIYVDRTLYLRRVEEHKQFRAALPDLLPAPPGEDLPNTFLLHPQPSEEEETR
ncbi:MAG: hypothetical protein P8Z00_13690 [Anaerolineales bacterium]|jgi:hypothetical protein